MCDWYTWSAETEKFQPICRQYPTNVGSPVPCQDETNKTTIFEGGVYSEIKCSIVIDPVSQDRTGLWKIRMEVNSYLYLF